MMSKQEYIFKKNFTRTDEYLYIYISIKNRTYLFRDCSVIFKAFPKFQNLIIFFVSHVKTISKIISVYLSRPTYTCHAECTLALD